MTSKQNPSELKKERYIVSSARSIRKILKQRWFVVVLALMLTALGAAITASVFKAGVHELDHWRLTLLKFLPAWIVLPLLGGCGGLISGTLVEKIAPAAGGSGISQIIAFLRHKSVPMGLRVGLVKLVSGIIAIGSGFPLGPEGPSVQMGGSVAWQMAKWLKAPVAFRRVIIAAGGGAGIAAVFNAPIGGFIYAIEELLNSAKPVILLLVVVTTFWADSWADVFQTNLLGQQTGGFDRILGFQLERTYTPEINFLPIDLFYLILLGCIIGCLAELYCRYVLTLQFRVTKWFGNKLILKMVVSGIIIGIMYSFLPTSFHSLEELQKLLVNGEIDMSISIFAFIALFISTGLAVASGAPGGLFYPMLTLGACIGFSCGSWLEISTGYIPNTFIFAGMGAFVAGCSRTPISAMFLAFALTKNLLILKPLLITTITSFLIARMFNEHSIYERQIIMMEQS